MTPPKRKLNVPRDIKEMLRFIACVLARHVGENTLMTVEQAATAMDQGILAQFWFNWRPIGVTHKVLKALADNNFSTFKGLRIQRHHLIDRRDFKHKVIEQACKWSTARWWRFYEEHNWTVIGFTDEKELSIYDYVPFDQDYFDQEYDPTNRILFENRHTGFRRTKAELAYLEQLWKRTRRR